jgi:holin-like protein
MIEGLLLLLVCQLGGEALSRALALPIPGPVLGMIIMILLLSFVPATRAIVTDTAHGVLRHLSLLFVPAGVGVIAHFDALAGQTLATIAALVLSTALALAVTALTFVRLRRIVGTDAGQTANAATPPEGEE